MKTINEVVEPIPEQLYREKLMEAYQENEFMTTLSSLYEKGYISKGLFEQVSANFNALLCSNRIHTTDDLKPNYTASYSKTINIPTDFDVVSVDKVNSPTHYNYGTFEVLDIIKECLKKIPMPNGIAIDRGNAIKYLLRAGAKPESGYDMYAKRIEDLRKCIYYINDEILELEKLKDK